MMFPPARRRFSRTKPLRMTFPPVEGGGRKSLSVGARSKDTPRTDLSISGEMVPSIVAEDGIALGVYCRLAEGQRHCFATRKTPLNSSRVLQCSGKGAT